MVPVRGDAMIVTVAPAHDLENRDSLAANPVVGTLIGPAAWLIHKLAIPSMAPVAKLIWPRNRASQNPPWLASRPPPPAMAFLRFQG
jgi:hypothetical protein